jgi:multiple sugar transport system permease protein
MDTLKYPKGSNENSLPPGRVFQTAHMGKIIRLVKAWSAKIVFYLFIAFWVFVSLFPFFYMIVMSTKTFGQLMSYPPKFFIDRDFIYNLAGGYQWLMRSTPFWKNIWNSFYIASMGTILNLLFCSLAGYGFAVFQFRGKELLFNIMIATMLIPPILNVIPYFSMMGALGWVNTPRAIYLPTLANALGIFLIRRHIESGVPKELLDCARIDGCSDFGIYWRIVLPMIKPGLGILMLITFLTSWNSYFYPMAILTAQDQQTVPLILNRVYGNLLAVSISILPIITVFLFSSKWIVSSITEGFFKD